MAGKGGAIPGNGRKPKADEQKLIEMMDSALVPLEAWKKLAELVQNKNVPAMRLWFAYRYGQPKQQIDHTTDGKALPPTITVLSAAAAKEIELLNSEGDG